MGRFCLAVVVLLFSAGSCPAQRLVVGEKAPELKVGEWLSHKDALSDSRPTLVEFFFSRSEPSLRRLAALDDGNRTFAAYGVQFVPFAVLFDARGRVVWFGNSSKFGDAELQRELGWN